MGPSGLNSVRLWDRAGMSASLACAVHCAMLPLLLESLPAVGLARLDSAWLDWTMVVFAAAIALRAHPGRFTVHRRCLPVTVAVAGRLIIVAKICLFKRSARHHYIQASGAVVVASSHFLNRHFCRNCVTCSATASTER
jgi:MerC mercury resistance protein